MFVLVRMIVVVFMSIVVFVVAHRVNLPAGMILIWKLVSTVAGSRLWIGPGHGDSTSFSRGSALGGRRGCGRGLRAGVQRAVRQAEGRGDRPVGHAPPIDVHPLGDSGIGCGQSLPTILRKLQDIGKRDVAKRIGAGPAHGAGHVGHAVVDHVIDDVRRVAVRGGPAGLDAAALVDGHVDDHRAGLHQRRGPRAGPGEAPGRR